MSHSFLFVITNPMKNNFRIPPLFPYRTRVRRRDRVLIRLAFHQIPFINCLHSCAKSLSPFLRYISLKRNIFKEQSLLGRFSKSLITDTEFPMLLFHNIKLCFQPFLGCNVNIKNVLPYKLQKKRMFCVTNCKRNSSVQWNTKNHCYT